MSPVVLSLVVPAYNAAETLPACLESVGAALREKDLVCEVVVVDDGSTDETRKIAEDYAARFPFVFRVLSKPNGHYGSCINAALPILHGRYVKILDADDTLDSAGFIRMLDALEGATEDLVVTGYRTCSPQGKILSEHLPRPLPDGVDTLSVVARAEPRYTVHMVAYARACLLRLNYRQIERLPYTDTQWILEPMVAVRRVRVLPWVVTHYTFGRAGQSMADATFAGSFDKVLAVAVQLVAHYPSLSSRGVPEGVAYYAYRLRRHIRWCLRLAAFGYHGHAVSADLSPLDRALAAQPELHTHVGRILRLLARLHHNYPKSA